MDRIERIRYMEQLFEKACDTIYSNNANIKNINDIQSVIYKLQIIKAAVCGSVIMNLMRMVNCPTI